jgi:UDP-N-acetylmuramoyl-tripeptide--D-alanyl-D-alanine ligase
MVQIAEIEGISIDTRTIKPGELFIAIRGKTLDGHNFIAEALKKGACGAVAAKDWLAESDIAAPLIRVQDTTRALGDIAAHHRRRFNPKVVAITGSNGKSTTKEMLAALLESQFTVLKPPSSFNNDIGVPLTVLALDRKTEVAIVEMEMNVLGGLHRLCEIAQPQVGVITNIHDTHLEFLHDRAGVAEEKSELLQFIGGDGTAVLNADDPLVMEIGRRFPTRERITFGINEPSDLRAEDIRDLGEPGLSFQLNGEVRIRLPVMGAHNVYNALAALAAGDACGLRLADALAGLESFRPLPLRLQTMHFGGMLVIIDCYNANPQSMSAALEVLGKTGARRRIAVLADMLELGRISAQAHFEVGKKAGAIADIVLAQGEHAPDVVRGAREAGCSNEEAFALPVAAPHSRSMVHKLIDILRPGDTILVKGSRANRLEEIAQELKTHYEEQDNRSTGTEH